jgi:asparagine synthase (glutamine-hydrolysing)
MSVQFGRWNFAGEPLAPSYIERVSKLLSPYGPDRSGFYSAAGVSITHCAFHTTEESRSEVQPHVSASGMVIAWDGRLDNRPELLGSLRDVLGDGATDVAIVAAAYERWGNKCLAQILGDWALAIWNPGARALLLAKDFIGVRHLFYVFDEVHVTWSTILDPLVSFSEKALALDEEYLAGLLSYFPAAHRTPYLGIHAVPPSSFVLLRPGECKVEKYWDFDPGKQIRYPADADYEDHFRSVFAQAVKRRLRSDRPVLAELSGGMDSSSIVCMADAVLAHGAAETPRLDTVSYYNDSEPDWNERPYFTKVEERRGRTGCHIEVGKPESTELPSELGPFAPAPFSRRRSSDRTRKFEEYLTSQGNRVVLSGIGGDEFMGGVPTPVPELMDLLARAHIKTLARQLTAWALNRRKPWIHLFLEAAKGFFPVSVVGVPKYLRPPKWLNPDFVKRQRDALRGYPSRINLFGPLPTFQECLGTIDALRRQLACSFLPREPLYEKRFPFLDRTLLEFICAIPRAQLVRPGERRSLMRRALAGIVPHEVLTRKRKAFILRSPTAAICTEWARLIAESREITSEALGILDASAFSKEVDEAGRGREVQIVRMSRMLEIESWLRAIRGQATLKSSWAKAGRNRVTLRQTGHAVREPSLKSSVS